MNIATKTIEKIEKTGGKFFLSPKFVKDNKEQTQPIQKVKKKGGEIILPINKEAKKKI